MKTVAFFNNKGGVGKTSLVYHLAWMLAELGYRVIAADFDPQANLSSMCVSENRLEEIWQTIPRPTVFSAIAPLKKGVGEIAPVKLELLKNNFALVLGDLSLSEFEDDLSANWSKCLDRDERGFRVTTAFSRIVTNAGNAFSADIGLIDVGPNLGAINRAALIAADYVVIPAAPDLFSVQGLENVGPRLLDWREGWQERRAKAPKDIDFELPAGNMRPVGYIVSRHSTKDGRHVAAFQKWVDRLPLVYRKNMEPELPAPEDLSIDDDDRCLAQLKDYRSLMLMAQEARKPMFLLKPGDGAIGGHQGAVQRCYQDFSQLAQKLADRIGLAKAS